MDLNVRRSHVVRVMLVVYAVFGFSLVYFLFFNTGLQIDSLAEAQNSSVVIGNDSAHAIRNITVVYLKDSVQNPMGEIPLLLPRESKAFPLAPAMADPSGVIVVLASAPFHLTSRSSIDTSNAAADALTSFQFSYPDSGYVNESIETIVNGCNTGSVSLSLRVALEIPSHSEWQPPEREWVIPSNDCTSTQISFIPTETVSNLFLKIRVFTPWRTLGEGSNAIAVIERPPVDENALNASQVNE